ncbi:MAG: 3-methyl-2-oxobutanoate hydroxymethyltransferase, partial [Calditrichaeota bacterium]|nr:3-methyl-2-oxobutanoate hydroxymethyltransferase [Calditrichota bacterium]
MSSQNKISKVTVPEIIKMKQRGEKIAVLTAYDALLAEILDSAGVDIIL